MKTIVVQFWDAFVEVPDDVDITAATKIDGAIHRYIRTACPTPMYEKLRYATDEELKSDMTDRDRKAL